MMPVAGITVSGPPLPSAAAAAEEENTPQRTAPQSAPQKPVMDEYIPEEKREPSGAYWVERDGNGEPRIHFDGPAEEAPEAGRPEKEPPEEETVRGSTDQVDREIEALKKERESLKRQLVLEDDEAKRGELEQKLNQIESELRRKDNDAYRRQHTVFS